jgi:hypothetical protein
VGDLFSAFYEVSARNSKRRLVMYCGFVLVLQQGFLGLRVSCVDLMLSVGYFLPLRSLTVSVCILLIYICCVVDPHYYSYNSYTQQDAKY